VQPVGVIFVVIGVAEVGVTTAKISVAILHADKVVLAIDEIGVLAKMFTVPMQVYC